MISQEEMDEYVAMAERDEWDPDRWKFSPNPRKGRLALVYGVSERQEAALEAKASARGQETDEYLDEVMSEVLEG